MTHEQVTRHWDAIVAFKEGKQIEMREPGMPNWHPTPTPEFLPDWEYREVEKPRRKYAAVVLEDMLAACIPGGADVNPQVIADSIRAYFHKEAGE